MEFEHARLVALFEQRLLQDPPIATIREARALAGEALGVTIRPGDALTKTVDEAIEAAVVRLSQNLVAYSDSPREAYQQLQGLLERQPNLGVKTSTSVLQQAYSTPVPIAYLANQLAGITGLWPRLLQNWATRLKGSYGVAFKRRILAF